MNLCVSLPQLHTQSVTGVTIILLLCMYYLFLFLYGSVLLARTSQTRHFVSCVYDKLGEARKLNVKVYGGVYNAGIGLLITISSQ